MRLERQLVAEGAGMSDIEFESVWVLKVLWLVLMAAAIGAIGGLGRYFREEEGADNRRLFKSIFLGAIAAVAAFYILEPTTPLKMIAACIISGYAGPTVLDALETRFKLLMAQEKAAQAIQVGEEAVKLVNETAATNRVGLRAESLSGDGSTEVLMARAQGLQSRLDALKLGTWRKGGAV